MALEQSTSDDGNNASKTTTLSLGVAPTIGNRLVFIVSLRGYWDGTVTFPTGFTTITESNSGDVSIPSHSVATKISDGTETSVSASWTKTDNWTAAYIEESSGLGSVGSFSFLTSASEVLSQGDGQIDSASRTQDSQLAYGFVSCRRDSRWDGGGEAVTGFISSYLVQATSGLARPNILLGRAALVSSGNVTATHTSDDPLGDYALAVVTLFNEAAAAVVGRTLSLLGVGR